jgi:type III secretory pathway component EscR
MLVTRCACLVDEAGILIPALAARSVISLVRLPIKMAFLFVVVNAVIQTARVLGVRMVSPYYLGTDWVWIFFFCWVATGTAKRQRPFQVANSL